ALRRAREELEMRVQERTAELARANEALQREMIARERAARDLESAQQRLLQAEIEKKQFYREVIRAVTGDRFHLVDTEEIPVEGDCLADLDLTVLTSSAPLRQPIHEAAARTSMPQERVDDLSLAVGEAAANAVKHGVEGRCTFYTAGDRLIVRVSDHGSGIRPEDLPSSILV